MHATEVKNGVKVHLKSFFLACRLQSYSYRHFSVMVKKEPGGLRDQDCSLNYRYFADYVILPYYHLYKTTWVKSF